MNKKDREELEQIITLAVERVALPDGRYSYYRATESILENYMTLKRVVADFDQYAADLSSQRSKSITSGSTQGGYRKSQDEMDEERLTERLKSFDKTANQLFLVDKVLDQFRTKKQFAIIERYYFNLDEDGNERGEERKSMAEIAQELGINEKTARRWRSRMVKDIAIVMFGASAAVSLTKRRPLDNT